MTATELATAPLEVRAVDTDAEGRHTIEALCVPYDRPTYAVALKGFNGERFARGAFADLLANPATWPKVRLTDNHVDGRERRPVAKATEFRDTADGLVGRWQFFNTPEGRGAFENVAEGTYGGVSVGFVTAPDGYTRTREGLREVRRARLHHVALVDEPAYREAQVLSARAAEEAAAERRRIDAELTAWAREHRAPLTRPSTDPGTLLVGRLL